SRDQFVVELSRQVLPFPITFGLIVHVERGKFFCEKTCDIREAIPRGGHRFNDVAGVLRRVITVIADEASVLAVRSEESAGSLFSSGLQRNGSAFSSHRPVRSEELLLAVHPERARILLLIRNVWSGSRCHEHRLRRQLDKTLALTAETQGHHSIVFIDDGLFR